MPGAMKSLILVGRININYATWSENASSVCKVNIFKCRDIFWYRESLKKYKIFNNKHVFKVNYSNRIKSLSLSTSCSLWFWCKSIRLKEISIYNNKIRISTEISAKNRKKEIYYGVCVTFNHMGGTFNHPTIRNYSNEGTRCVSHTKNFCRLTKSERRTFRLF